MLKKIVITLVAALSLLGPLNAQMVYEEKPENFEPKIEVAVCFIQTDDKVLFLKRLPWKPQGDTWGIPGGKFDPGETPQDTVIRETWEETGIAMPKEALSYFGKVFVRYPDMDYTLHMFEYKADDLPEVTFNPEEHADYKWVSLKEAMDLLPLIPGEEECIDLVYGGVPPEKLEHNS